MTFPFLQPARYKGLCYLRAVWRPRPKGGRLSLNWQRFSQKHARQGHDALLDALLQRHHSLRSA